MPRQHDSNRTPRGADQFDGDVRRALEAVLRAARLQDAQVVRTARKRNVKIFDVAPGSISDETRFVKAVEAQLGRSIASFTRPPSCPAFHFEIEQ